MDFLLEWLEDFDFDPALQILQWVGAVAIFVILILILRVFIKSFRSRGKPPRKSHPVLEHMKKPKELPHGDERILVVDDDPTTLQVNSRLLIGLGYEVLCAHGGEEAIEFVKQISVKLILLDLVMDPGINGVETLRRIKAIRPKTKAIILSGYAQPSQVAEAQKLGAGKYLIKPAPVGTLAWAIREELDK